MNYEIIAKKKTTKIFITGAYKLEDIKEFVKDTDIVLNLYENDKQQKPAMTVKFYDSIMYDRPMIVNKDSYMAELVSEYNLGMISNLENDKWIDELYNNYINFDYENYEENRKKIYNNILKDDKEFEKKLINEVKRSK